MDSFDAKFRFDPARRYHLGVEEQVWTVHKDTGRPVPRAQRIFRRGYQDTFPQLKPGFASQQLGAFTPIKHSIGEIGAALRSNNVMLEAVARRNDCRISRSPVAEKPFLVRIHPLPRNLEVRARYGRRVAHACVNSMHVHVGVGSKEEALTALQVLRFYLPSLLLLSARSPRIIGTRQYVSYRHWLLHQAVGEIVPPLIPDWRTYTLAAQRGSFHHDPRLCQWAVRINPHGTIETRVFDTQQSLQQQLGLVALTRLLVRGAIEGKIKVERLGQGVIDRWLSHAAEGQWKADQLGQIVHSLDRERGYAEDVYYSRKLFKPR